MRYSHYKTSSLWAENAIDLSLWKFVFYAVGLKSVLQVVFQIDYSACFIAKLIYCALKISWFLKAISNHFRVSCAATVVLQSKWKLSFFFNIWRSLRDGHHSRCYKGMQSSEKWSNEMRFHVIFLYSISFWFLSSKSRFSTDLMRA